MKANTDQKLAYKIKEENGSYILFKINYTLKRITQLKLNKLNDTFDYNICVVTYPDFDSNITEIEETTGKLHKSDWKHHENMFFISRDFEWEHDGKKYKTNSDEIKWKDSTDFRGREATVFHNGKIWTAYLDENCYPKIQIIQLETIPNDEITTLPYFKKVYGNSKWTDVKYIRNFDEVYDPI